MTSDLVGADRTESLLLFQRRLERFYGLESAPDVVDFVRTGTSDDRETLYVKQEGDSLEVALVLPAECDASGDVELQLIEGVSHFVYLAERARTELPTTRLELEIQAEVDKFVMLWLSRDRVEPGWRRAVREMLYGNVRFLHPPQSEPGARYRLANRLAAKLVTALERRSDQSAQSSLVRFYRAGQAEKIRMARAA